MRMVSSGVRGAAIGIGALALWLGAAARSPGGFTALSPVGTSGPGGVVTAAEIGDPDATSANVNASFTALGSIPVTFAVSGGDPVSLFGTAVNFTGLPWSGFTARVTAGVAAFRGPDDPFDPYGTYTTLPGWSVTLGDGGRLATFAGGSVAPGDGLDVFLGIVVGDPTRPVTIELAPAAAVPEPASGALVLLAASAWGLARGRARAWILGAAVVGAGAGAAARADSPAVAPAFLGRVAVRAVGAVPGSPTQLAFGPDGRVYAMTTDAGPIRFDYDPAAGTLAGATPVAPNVRGIGIGFRGADLYLSGFDGTIHKLRDGDGDGSFNGPGDSDVAIVTGIPQGDHNIDQIQIAGDTLYVGIGRRTINGRLGAYTGGTIDDLGGRGFFAGGTGRTYGDSAYNGTIAWIRDLKAVPDQVGAANAFDTSPPVPSRALIQADAGPFRAVDPGKLVVHSAGTRNPFGLCLARDGSLWFTNNFNRTPSLGNGQAGFGLRGDQLPSDLSTNVHDQLFRASPGADYGYFDSNWRGVNPMMTPGSPGYHRVRSTTFDNSFNPGPYTLHDPANPDGLGPSASADGCTFADHPRMPAEVRGNIFVLRYNGTITEAPGGAGRSLTYSDLVAVDPATGQVRRVAAGFNGPLAILADDAAGRLLVANLGDRVVYAVEWAGP